LQKALHSGEKHLRWEAERILKRRQA
jgi:hypothetical protein